jgi:hypothetical protein
MIISTNKEQNLPGVTSARWNCSLARLIISAIQSAGAFRFIYTGVIILDQARRAVTALNASAGARVSRHVGRALRVHLRAAFVVHVSVGAFECCKYMRVKHFLPSLFTVKSLTTKIRSPPRGGYIDVLISALFREISDGLTGSLFLVCAVVPFACFHKCLLPIKFL